MVVFSSLYVYFFKIKDISFYLVIVPAEKEFKKEIPKVFL